jgi:hypothetical protein
MGLMQILDPVCIGYGKDFHSGSFRAADPWDRILDDQAGSGGDGVLRALSNESVEGLEKRLWIGLSSGHVFCAGDVKEFFSEPRVLEDHLDFMAEGAGGNGQGIGSGGFTHELTDPWENDLVVTYRIEIGMGFPLHQLRERRWVYGMLVCGECRDKAAPIIVSQVLGIVVGFSQLDTDFSERVAEAGKMKRLGVRNHAVKVKDHRCECRHGIVSIVRV